MKTARLSLFLVWSFALSVFGAAPVSLLVETNGALRAPVDFFTLNSNLIVAAIGGALGGGSGNASTNATQAWAATNTQTFLGPVYFGTTNAVTELAGKQNSDAQLDVVANLTSGTATNFLAGDGTFKQVTTNMIPGLVADILAAAAAGGGGDVTLAGTNLFTGPNTFGGATTISNLTVPGTMTVGSVSFGTPLGLSNGGTGGTNAETARTALGLAIGSDVQAWSAYLQQLATVSWSSGNVPYFDGSNLTNLVTTAAGRTLLSAANAAAQWSELLSSATTNGAYNATTWDGITDRAPTLDQFRDVIAALPGGSNAIFLVESPLTLTNGVLGIDISGLGGGGGGGFDYILTNSLGTFTSSATTTNWPVIDTVISSNDLPTAVGKFIDGGFSMITSNDSGTTSTNYFTVKVNGTTVFRDSATSSPSSTTGVKGYIGNFYLVYESASTASLVCFGGIPSPIQPEVGIGDFSGNMVAMTFVATNIAVSWTTNLTLSIAIENPTTVSTPAAHGMRRIYAWMRRDADATSGSGDVVGPASSTDSVVALYDGTTGKLLKNGTLTEAAINAHLTEAEASALYQRTNAFLTGLSTGDGADLTNLNASSIASGTISSNRLPDAISLTTLSAGTMTATSVSGDGSGLTNLSGSNIASGTVADARIDTAIARTNAPTLHSPTLLTPSLGAASATSLTIGATNVVTDLALKAPLASPALTGTPTVNSTNLMAAIDGKAALNSPAFTGSPTVPTASSGTSNTVAASTKYVDDAVAASPGGSEWTNTTTSTELAEDHLPSTDSIYSASNGGGSVGSTAAEFDHWGLRAITANSTNDFPSLTVYTTGALHITNAPSAMVLEFECVVKTPSTLSTADDTYQINAGFIGGTISSTNLRSDMISIGYDTNRIGANWGLLVVSNTVPEITDSGVALQISTWYTNKIKVTSSNAVAYINGTPVATNSSRLPWGRALGFGYQVVQSSGSGTVSKTLTVDKSIFRYRR